MRYYQYYYFSSGTVFPRFITKTYWDSPTMEIQKNIVREGRLIYRKVQR